MVAHLFQIVQASEWFRLGKRLYSGFPNLPQDYSEAMTCYLKAAEKGHVEAMYNIGEMHTYGKGGPIDLTNAMDWFRKASDLGSEKADVAIGLLYDHGLGVAEDHTEALRWFQKAVNAGCTQAKMYLK